MARSVERDEYFDKQHINAFYYDAATGHVMVHSTPGTIPKAMEEYEIFVQTAYKPIYAINENNGHLEVTV